MWIARRDASGNKYDLFVNDAKLIRGDIKASSTRQDEQVIRNGFQHQRCLDPFKDLLGIDPPSFLSATSFWPLIEELTTQIDQSHHRHDPSIVRLSPFF